MKIFLLILTCIAIFVIRPLRCIAFNFISVIINLFRDLFFYFYNHEYDSAKKTIGRMICFCGLFGYGKTLSLVHTVVKMFKRYNNKKIRIDGKLVTQRVCVLSNVELTSIPYYQFNNLQDLVNLAQNVSEYDLEHDTYTVIYVIFDEIQNALYCRNYKSNLTPDALRVLTQIRKYHLSIYMTSTRFSQTDCTIRQDCMYTVDCSKFWRIARNVYYDSWEYENAFDVSEIKPIEKKYWFVRNKDYNAYYTNKLTEIISNDIFSGNVIPFDERNLQNDVTKVNIENKIKMKRKLFK